MKPAWATDEYASIRLMSDWTTARIDPTSMVRVAMIQMIGSQSHRTPPKAT